MIVLPPNADGITSLLNLISNPKEAQKNLEALAEATKAHNQAVLEAASATDQAKQAKAEAEQVVARVTQMHGEYTLKVKNLEAKQIAFDKERQQFSAEMASTQELYKKLNNELTSALNQAKEAKEQHLTSAAEADKAAVQAKTVVGEYNTKLADLKRLVGAN